MKTKLLSTILLLFFSAVQVVAQCNINYSYVMGYSDVEAEIYWESPNPDEAFTIEYGPENFTLGEGETVNGQKNGSFSEIFTLTGLTPSTNYHYYITETCNGGQGVTYGPEFFRTDSECRSPQNIIGISLSSTSIKISWTSLNDGSVVNFTSYNGLINYQGVAQFGYNEIIIENLIVDTDYSGTLSEVCSGQSSGGWYVDVRTDTECRTPIDFTVENVTGTTATLSWQSFNGGVPYTVEYGNFDSFEEPGTGEGEVTGISDENNEITITGLSPMTSYKVTLVETCEGEGQTRLQQTNFYTPDVCSQPSYSVWEKSMNTLLIEVYTFNFDNGNTSEEGEYTIEYGIEGFTQGEGQMLTGTFSTNWYEILIENLLPETKYDIYLTEKCNEADVTVQFQETTISECEPIRESYFYVENRGIGEVLIEWYDSYNSGRPYTIEYGIEGFTQGEGITRNGIVNTWGGGRVTISELEQNTTYDFYYIESCANSEFTTAVKKTITTISDCEIPYNFEIRTEGSNDVLLTFDNYNIGQQYTIEYGLTEFVQGTGLTKSAEVTNRYMDVLIDGLEDETNYDFYLTISCPIGNTDIVGPISATTTELVTAPANDLCTNAIVVIAGNEYTGTNAGATATDRPDVCIGFNDFDGGVSEYAKGVWYRFNATSTTPIVFSLCNEDSEDFWAAQMEVYKGSCGSFECVKATSWSDNCNNDSPIITIQPEVGASYYIYVSGSNNRIGDFRLDVSENNDYQPCVLPTNVQVTEIESDKATFSWEPGTISSYYFAGVFESGSQVFDEEPLIGDEGEYSGEDFIEISLSGLEEGKTYDFYVFEECESIGEYVLAGPFTFTTIISNVGKNTSYNHQTMAYLIQVGDAIQIQDIENEIVEINVFDMSSTPVSYQKQGNTITLQTSTSGMYILKMLTAEGYRFAKVIVQ